MLRYDLYLYKKVRIKLKTGRILEGSVRSFAGEMEAISGEPELYIDKEFGIIEPVGLSEIDTIDILAE